MKSYYQDDYATIYHGDCREILPQLETNTIDLILTDPPYNIGVAKWDNMDIIDSNISIEFHRLLKDSGSLYIWCGIGEKGSSLIRWFPIFERNFIFKDLITWSKQRGYGMRKGWLYTREEIMWFVKDNSKYIWNKENQYSTKRSAWGKVGFYGKEKASEFDRLTNVWTDIQEQFFESGKNQEDIGHPTAKPIPLMNRIILVHTNTGDCVLDPFMGSGSTLRAAKNIGLKAIGIEIEEKYCELAAKNMGQSILTPKVNPDNKIQNKLF